MFRLTELQNATKDKMSALCDNTFSTLPFDNSKPRKPQLISWKEVLNSAVDEIEVSISLGAHKFAQRVATLSDKEKVCLDTAFTKIQIGNLRTIGHEILEKRFERLTEAAEAEADAEAEIAVEKPEVDDERSGMY
jgi:hypothetical protein